MLSKRAAELIKVAVSGYYRYIRSPFSGQWIPVGAAGYQLDVASLRNMPGAGADIRNINKWLTNEFGIPVEPEGFAPAPIKGRYVNFAKEPPAPIPKGVKAPADIGTALTAFAKNPASVAPGLETANTAIAVSPTSGAVSPTSGEAATVMEKGTAVTVRGGPTAKQLSELPTKMETSTSAAKKVRGLRDWHVTPPISDVKPIENVIHAPAATLKFNLGEFSPETWKSVAKGMGPKIKPPAVPHEMIGKLRAASSTARKTVTGGRALAGVGSAIGKGVVKSVETRPAFGASLFKGLGKFVSRAGKGLLRGLKYAA